MNEQFVYTESDLNLALDVLTQEILKHEKENSNKRAIVLSGIFNKLHGYATAKNDTCLTQLINESIDKYVNVVKQFN